VITSNGAGAGASINVAENSTAVTTVTATDADAGATLTYSVTGGADAAKFTINASTGELTFVSAPDFEAPTDAGGNNVYDVQVQVSDGTNTDTQDIAITVTNVSGSYTGTAGADALMGSSEEDTIAGLGGDDTITGGAGADTSTGGAGADTFVIGVVSDLAAGETINGTAEAGTIDTLRLDAAGTYDLSTFSTITNIDAIALNVNAAGFNLTVADSQVSTADANGDGTQNDLQIGAAVAMTNGVTIDASGLTGSNRITVVGTNLGGADTITGGAGADVLDGGAGADTITGGAGNDTVTGGAGVDNLTGGLGADTFIIGAVADLAAGETIDGTSEAGTTDTLRLDAAGTFDFSSFSTISNIDAIVFNTNAAGFNVTVTDSQVSTADANGDGTKNDLRFSAAIAMTNGVTINASGLTGLNRIVVVGANLAGADILIGGAAADTIDAGAGADTITGGAGADVLTGGTGADTFVIGAVADLAAGETIDGTAEAGTIDTLRLDAAGTYNLSGFTTITNIDAVALNVNAAGFNLTVADSQVSTADANGDGTQNDLQISASVAMTNGVTINASGLTGSNRIIVVGTNLGGADVLTGGAGADTIDGGAGNDTITGGAGVDTLIGGLGADTFIIGAVSDLAVGETIDGTAEAATIDTLQLDGAGTYNLSTFTTITNIDAITFNVNAAGFNLTVADSQVSTADANGDGTQNDLQIGASVAMTNGVTIDASGLTGSNRIVVVGTNLGAADTITGGAGADTIDGGAGADTITGGAGADVLTGGTGADTFVIGAVSDLAAGETINGTAEAGTTDTLRLDAAGTYNLSTFSTITNIDAISLNVNAAGFNLTVADSQVSTADANGDGTQNDLQISAAVAMTNSVTIDASGLTGSNRITVVGTNLGGADTITAGAGVDTIDGGAGADVITGGAGADVLTGGAGADTFAIGAVSDLAAGETINGTSETGTIDTLRLDAAGTYNLSTFTTITNIDAIALNVDAAGFNLTVVDSQVSTADANGDGTQNDLQISASVAMTNAVTINASGLTGTNRINVVGTNLGGADIITGGAGADTIDGGAGADTITGGAGVDTLTGGTGADTFVIGTVAHLAAGETINGTAEAGTIDTLRLDAAGTYDLSTFSTITNIDSITFNVNAAGFDLTVADSQVSTADANGDGTQNDLQISASVAMTNGVTIDASGLTGTNRITVVGTNLGGADIITGGAGADTIDGGVGADTITGGAGVDTLTGGTGADTFVIDAVAELAAGETINGTSEAGTIDTLQLDAAGTYNLSTFTTITNIDAIAFNVNASGFNLTVANSQVSTADANGDGTQNDIQISAAVAMTNGVTISGSGLTGANRITVIGTNLGGADTITGGAGVDTIAGGAGNDSLSGGAGNDTYNFGLTDGTDTITESGVGTADSIVILASGADLTTLDFTDSSTTATTGNLVISYNGQQITVTNHFVGGNNVVETLTFSGGATYAGFSLGTGAYTLSTDDNGSRTSTAGVNTILIGASGAETLTGNTGNDLIFGGAGIDTISSGDGTNLMVGGAGNDSLTGGTGADWLVGGTNTDTLAGAAGNDTYVFALTDGTDTINESGVGTADSIVIQGNGAALSTLDFTDSSTTAATGNLVIAYNGQQITVTSHFVGTTGVVETLSFSGGATYGGYSLGSGSYTLSIDDSGTRAAAVGVNTILGGSSNADTMTGDTGNDLIFGGGGADTISGGNGTNLLVGDAGNDGITGGTGSDWLIGGAGTDTLTGGTGADYFVFLATTDGTDTIADFTTAQGDKINILVSAFGGGLTTGTDPTTVFGSSASNTFGSASERFHYNTSTGQLLYDADGTGAGAAVTLATFTGLPTLTGTDLQFI
jgi:Ca2+-binding RTX toxin-like protein